MLQDTNAIATIAVKDLNAAKKFYGGTLGFKESGTNEPGVLAYRSGSSFFLVYQSSYAGTNKATAVTWLLGKDFDEVVKALKAKGVVFEHYDLPGLTRTGDVHVGGKHKAAWFKDPDGNILAINNG